METFYVHMEFFSKKGIWSINLPFACSRCGVCCTLDDFLTAGLINAKPQEHPEIDARLKIIYDHLEQLLEKGEDKYNDYVMHTPCPFLTKKTCSIYSIRPAGCREFPNTRFGIDSKACESLNRFHKQRMSLKKGRLTKQTYYFTNSNIKPAKFTERQFRFCMEKLQRAGINDEELSLFKSLNKKS